MPIEPEENTLSKERGTFFLLERFATKANPKLSDKNLQKHSMQGLSAKTHSDNPKCWVKLDEGISKIVEAFCTKKMSN